MSNDWSRSIPPAQAHARAGGRRSYNARRRRAALSRRRRLVERLGELGFTWGIQARLAAELGVSPATVSRDLAAVFPLAQECPCCGSLVERRGLPELLAQALNRNGLGVTRRLRGITPEQVASLAGFGPTAKQHQNSTRTTPSGETE